MAEARPERDGPGGDGGEFVVIERLETLKNRQDELENNIRLLRSLLEEQQQRSIQMLKTCDMVENIWKVFRYSMLLTLPATLAFIIDFKLKQPYDEYLSMASILVGFSIFIGVPSLFLAFYNFDFFETEEDKDENEVQAVEDDISTASEFESEDDNETEPEDIGTSVDKDINNNDVEPAAENQMEF